MRNGSLQASFSRSTLLGAVLCIASQSQATTQVALTIVDAETKLPISNASVRHGASDATALTTDSAGRVDLKLSSSASARRVLVRVSASGYPEMRINWLENDPALGVPETFTLEMPKAVAIGGRVEDANGLPVADATVRVTLPASNLQEVVAFSFSANIQTDSDGRWVVPNAPPTWSRLLIGAYHPTRGGLTADIMTSRPTTFAVEGPALLKQDYVSKLEAVREIIGQVVDEHGTPIENADVARGTDRFGGSNPIPLAKTDTQGRYRITGVPEAEHVLTITAPGRSPVCVRVRNTEDLGENRHVLPPGNQLSGRLVDEAGKPIPKATIRILGFAGIQNRAESLRSNDDGEFNWTSAPGEPVTVDISASGYKSEQGLTLTPNQPATITLKSPLTFRFKVIDATTREPIQAFTAQTGSFDSRAGTPTLAGLVSPRPVVDSEQEYTVRLQDASPASFVRIASRGYAPLDSKPIRSGSGIEVYIFEMVRSADITGTLLLPDGKPATGTRLTLLPVGTQFQWNNDKVRIGASTPVRLAIVDDAGAFQFPAETPGFSLVATNETGYLFLADPDLQSGTPLTIRPWGKISGTVLNGTAPVANAQIDLHSTYRLSLVSMDWQINTLKATTDEHGRFFVDRATEGTWTIRQRGDAAAPLLTRPAAQVSVKPGERVEVTLGGTGKTVRGKLTLSPDVPADAVFSSIQLRTHHRLPAPPRSQDELDKLPEEDRAAYLQPPEYKQFLEQRTSIASLRRDSFLVAVHPDGSFQLDHIKPGEYEVWANAVLSKDAATSRLSNPVAKPGM